MRDNKDPVWEPLAQDSPAIDDPVSWPYQWSHVARNITVKSWLFHNHVSRPSPRAPGKPATIISKITKTSALLRTENWFNRVETLISWIKHVENFIIRYFIVDNEQFGGSRFFLNIYQTKMKINFSTELELGNLS